MSDGPRSILLTTLPFSLSTVLSSRSNGNNNRNSYNSTTSNSSGRRKANRQSTDLRLDALCAPVNIAVTSQDIILLVDAVNDIVDVVAGQGEVTRVGVEDGWKTVATLAPPPRIAVLSPLCLLHVNFTLDDLNFSLLSDRYA